MRRCSIVLSDPMVRAVLAGKKTMVRRVIDLSKPCVLLPYEVRSEPMIFAFGKGLALQAGTYPATINPLGAVCGVLPDGQRLGLKPGEFEWVCPYARGTTTLASGTWHILPRGGQRLCIQEAWTEYEVDDVQGERVFYKADYQDGQCQVRPGTWLTWKPAITMPRGLSRITPSVLWVRVERLQSITEADARAEGVDAVSLADVPRQGCLSVIEDFAQLWNLSTASERPGCSWQDNPWVWAIEFEKFDSHQSTHAKARRRTRSTTCASDPSR